MEEALNMHIDAKTLEENFSKNEQKIIRQLQDVGTNGGKPPQMTPQGRTALLEKLHNINNKPKETKDTKDMTPEELLAHKADLRARIRFKTNARSSKFNQNTDSINSSVNTPAAPAPPVDLTDANSLKNLVGQMTGSNANPEVKKRLDRLFKSENIDDLLKDDKMKEVMDMNGFSELFKNFAGQGQPQQQQVQQPQTSSSNKKKSNKKKRSKKNKKPPCVIENFTENDLIKEQTKKEEEKEELLDDYVEEIDEKIEN